jgi:hypothetical protein
MENGKKLEFPEGQEGVRGNQGFPLPEYMSFFFIKNNISMPKIIKSKPTKLGKALNSTFTYLHNHINALNSSKLFAGLMIIILNIASRFVNVKLSKSMESYLKFTFSRHILIFAIAWMGTRDIYVALLITIAFSICIDYLFNEDSSFCCLSEDFTSYHTELINAADVSGNMNQGTPSTSPAQHIAHNESKREKYAKFLDGSSPRSESLPTASNPVVPVRLPLSTPLITTSLNTDSDIKPTNPLLSGPTRANKSSDVISDEEIRKAQEVLEKAKRQKSQLQSSTYFKYN